MLILTAISLVVYFLSTGQRDAFFIKDLALAISGSAFLSAIIALLEYLDERQLCML